MNDNSNDFTHNAMNSAHVNSAHDSHASHQQVNCTSNGIEPTPKIRSEVNINQETLGVNDSDM